MTIDSWKTNLKKKKKHVTTNIILSPGVPTIL